MQAVANNQQIDVSEEENFGPQPVTKLEVSITMRVSHIHSISIHSTIIIYIYIYIICFRVMVYLPLM